MEQTKPRKANRDEIARIQAQEKRERTDAVKVQVAKIRNDYITDIVNGRYFFARCNMIAEQLIAKTIMESIDGCIKTEEFMKAEYAHQKIQAIKSHRNAHFAKQELINKFEHTQEDFDALEEDYYNGKIVREEYDELYKKRNKTQFTNPD